MIQIFIFYIVTEAYGIVNLVYSWLLSLILYVHFVYGFVLYPNNEMVVRIAVVNFHILDFNSGFFGFIHSSWILLSCNYRCYRFHLLQLEPTNHH